MSSMRGFFDVGDFARLAGPVVVVAEELCDAAEIGARESVLDVGCANGNVALAAARRRGLAVGIDPVRGLLRHARARAEVEYLSPDFARASVGRLPFRDERFDAVLSSFGVAFAPDADRACAEMLRVCRPEGRIALANWTSEGFTGRAVELAGRALRSRGARFDPLRWGRKEEIERLFGEQLEPLSAARRRLRLNGDSPGAMVDGLLRFLGPLRAADLAEDDAGKTRLRTRLGELVEAGNLRTDGRVRLESEWLLFVGRRRRSSSASF